MLTEIEWDRMGCEPQTLDFHPLDCDFIPRKCGKLLQTPLKPHLWAWEWVWVRSILITLRLFISLYHITQARSRKKHPRYIRPTPLLVILYSLIFVGCVLVFQLKAMSCHAVAVPGLIALQATGEALVSEPGFHASHHLATNSSGIHRFCWSNPQIALARSIFLLIKTLCLLSKSGTFVD